MDREQMNIVIVGHVDHGKSTVIGRLLADTGSLPQGKLEQVKAHCASSARPFEYAFLLDALKEEQSQGITIDTARCFFKTARRDYIIIDAPGHVEFLKNMVSGAARAEAALLVIDAHEGVAENSRRHGYLVSMLGIRQLVVLVNKMDLVGYQQARYESIVGEYRAFLDQLGVKPVAFVPISAREGDNLVKTSAAMPWHTGPAVLELMDGFQKQTGKGHKPFRFPVQDVYKFTAQGDDRRIIAGQVESGQIAPGEEVVFLSSGKKSHILTVEGFPAPPAGAGPMDSASGFTLTDELYLKPGEVMCRATDPLPLAATRFRANIFWMGRGSMVREKKYKIKIGTARSAVRLVEVVSCLDASELVRTTGKQQIDRHDVAECIFETTRPIAIESFADHETTGRFVIVDNYDIAGGGIILAGEEEGRSWLADHVKKREIAWDKGLITSDERAAKNGHRPKCLVLCGGERRAIIARALEQSLSRSGFQSYYLGLENLLLGLDADAPASADRRETLVYQLGELSRILTDAGLIFISALEDAEESDLAMIRKLNFPSEVLVVSVDDQTGIHQQAGLCFDAGVDNEACVAAIVEQLQAERIIPDYSI